MCRGIGRPVVRRPRCCSLLPPAGAALRSDSPDRSTCSSRPCISPPDHRCDSTSVGRTAIPLPPRSKSPSPSKAPLLHFRFESACHFRISTSPARTHEPSASAHGRPDPLAFFPRPHACSPSAAASAVLSLRALSVRAEAPLGDGRGPSSRHRFRLWVQRRMILDGTA